MYRVGVLFTIVNMNSFTAKWKTIICIRRWYRIEPNETYQTKDMQTRIGQTEQTYLAIEL